jgi:hypothetical protein
MREIVLGAIGLSLIIGTFFVTAQVADPTIKAGERIEVLSAQEREKAKTLDAWAARLKG